MHSFSLPKGSPVTLEEMQEKLKGSDEAVTLLLIKRHFGKDATLRINGRVFSTFADIQAVFGSDLPDEYLEWDKLIVAGVVNRIWAERNEERLKKVASASNRMTSARRVG